VPPHGARAARTPHGAHAHAVSSHKRKAPGASACVVGAARGRAPLVGGLAHAMRSPAPAASPLGGADACAGVLDDDERAFAAKEQRARRQAANRQRSEGRVLAARQRMKLAMPQHAQQGAARPAAVLMPPPPPPAALRPPAAPLPPPQSAPPQPQPPQPAVLPPPPLQAPPASRAAEPPLPPAAWPANAAAAPALSAAAFAQLQREAADAALAAPGFSGGGALGGASSVSARPRAPIPADESGLHELQNVVMKLDSQMRVSIQESLFRLAASYRVRSAEGAAAAAVAAAAAAAGGDGDGGRNVRARHAGAAAGGGSGGASKWTSMIDESVATLLYHRYWESADV
jgi:hypothetical protein